MKQSFDAVASVRIGEPVTFKNMTVFPLLGGNGAAADYLTLDEALEQKVSMITEVSEGGSVPELKFVNSGDKRVFLLDGEELVGAKQNRILNLSIMVPAGKTLVVPVSCVEAGRWHHRSRHFASAPRAQYAEGRAKKMAQVSASMKASGRRASNQGEVWKDIDEKFSKLHCFSSTSAMSDIYEQQSVRLEDYVRAFKTIPAQVGAIFAIDGGVYGLELFDSPDTLHKLFPKLLRSYGLDALSQPSAGSEESQPCPAPTMEMAEAFLKKVRAAKKEEFAALGEGQDLRLSGPALVGAALAVDEQLVHLSAFAD
jgi:hypothetical protein